MATEEGPARETTVDATGDAALHDEYPDVLWVDMEVENAEDAEAALLEIEAATDGIYHRVTEVGPDGLPIWLKEDGASWLFSGTHGSHKGVWCVGDEEFKDVQFGHKREGSAFVSSVEPHQGRPPQKLTAWYSCGMYCAVSVTAVGTEAYAVGDWAKVIEEGFDKSVGGYERKGTFGKRGEVVEVGKQARPYKIRYTSDESKVAHASYEAAWLQRVQTVNHVFGPLRWDDHHVIHWDSAEHCVQWWDNAIQKWHKLEDETKDVFESFPLATSVQIEDETGSPGLLESTVTCL